MVLSRINPVGMLDTARREYLMQAIVFLVEPRVPKPRVEADSNASITQSTDIPQDIHPLPVHLVGRGGSQRAFQLEISWPCWVGWVSWVQSPLDTESVSENVWMLDQIVHRTKSPHTMAGQSSLGGKRNCCVTGINLYHELPGKKGGELRGRSVGTIQPPATHVTIVRGRNDESQTIDQLPQSFAVAWIKPRLLTATQTVQKVEHRESLALSNSHLIGVGKNHHIGNGPRHKGTGQTSPLNAGSMNLDLQGKHNTGNENFEIASHSPLESW